MAKPETVRYSITLTIDRPIRWADCDVEHYTPTEIIEEFTESKELRRVEKEVIQALKKLDGDCDCEVDMTELLDADGMVCDERDTPPEDLSWRQRRGDY